MSKRIEGGVMEIFSIVIDTFKGFKSYEWWQMAGCLLFVIYFSSTEFDRDSVAGIVLCLMFALSVFTSSGWRQQSKQWIELQQLLKEQQNEQAKK